MLQCVCSNSLKNKTYETQIKTDDDHDQRG